MKLRRFLLFTIAVVSIGVIIAIAGIVNNSRALNNSAMTATAVELFNADIEQQLGATAVTGTTIPTPP